MVETILSEKCLARTRELTAIHGPMPVLDSAGCNQQSLAYWIKKLMTFERALADVTTPRDAVRLWSAYFAYANNSDQIWADWARVLAAHRVRKLGEPTEANQIQVITNFSGYSFNIRSR
jgi:hypothetical protein